MTSNMAQPASYALLMNLSLWNLQGGTSFSAATLMPRRERSDRPEQTRHSGIARRRQRKNKPFSGFDGTVRRGERLKAHSTHFARQYGEIDGPQSGLFSLGSTIYNVVTRRVPFHDIDDDEEVERLFVEGQFPHTDGLFCGPLIQGCWTRGYDSVLELSLDAKRNHSQTTCTEHSFHGTAQMLDEATIEKPRQRCEAFRREIQKLPQQDQRMLIQSKVPGYRSERKKIPWVQWKWVASM